MDRLREEMTSEQFTYWAVFLKHEMPTGDRVDIMCAKVLAMLAAFGGKKNLTPSDVYSDPWDESYKPGWKPTVLTGAGVIAALKGSKIKARTKDGKKVVL